MARSIWSGAVSFGLVNVPVKLYSATSPKSVRFHQLSAATGARVRQKRVDSSTGEEVNYEGIVKGYEITPDRYVIIEPAELEAVSPKKTRMIEIEKFVDLADIDPVYYDHTYYLAPDTGAGKAYRLLTDAIEERGRVALGRIILRSKEQLVALRVRNGILTASTMLFGDEVLDEHRIVELDETAEPTEREVKMAGMLIDSLTDEFDPSQFTDTYRQQVLDLIERKAAGEKIETPAAEEESAPAPDLLAALEASLKTTTAEVGEPKPPARKRAAKPRTKAAA